VADSDDTLHTFDDARGWHMFLADALRGGWAWEHPSSATLGVATLYGNEVLRDSHGREVIAEVPRGTHRTYLVPWRGETEENFRRRRALAFYVNLVEPVCDAYVDTVTGNVSRSLGALESYVTNLDGDGQGWAEHVATVASTACVHGVCAVVIEPPLSNAATTREEERTLGVSVRARVIAPQAWAWMRVDRDGQVEAFAYAESPEVSRTATTHVLRVWEYTRERWALYEGVVNSADTIAQSAPVLLATQPAKTGEHPPTMRGRVPVVFAYHRRDIASVTPAGRPLAATPAAIGRQVYQLLSQVEDTQRRAPPFLAVPTQARGGLEPETAAKVGPDSALPIPEGSGAPQWVTFPSESLEDLRAHTAYLVALAYRVCGLEVQADQSAQVQSGEALRVRSRDFEARALKFSRDCAAYEARALALIARMLGVASDAVVTYPRRFVLGDSAELLSAALLVLQHLGPNLGVTGVAETMRQAITSALTLDDAQVQAVMDEVTKRLAEPQQATQKEIFGYDYDAGIVTVNEARRTKGGLEPIKGGDVPVSEWVAQINARAKAYEAQALASVAPKTGGE
jgi:hypothetical protein